MLAKLAASLPPVTFQVSSSSLGNKVITLRILFIDLIRQPYRACDLRWSRGRYSLRLWWRVTQGFLIGMNVYTNKNKGKV